MHTVIMQVREGIRVRECLEYLRTLGLVRIIFPPHEYGTPDWSALGEEETRRLEWGQDRVRELIDGDGPIPHGLDPDAIAAARLIARHLSNCRNL